MRTFLCEHWKALVAIVLLVALALFTVHPGAAIPEPSLASRLHTHVRSIASGEHNSAAPVRLEQTARYIENVLKTEGYAIRRQAYRAGGQMVRNIEVSIARVAPGARPARIFIVGARYDEYGSGTAAVLELARLLKTLRPSQGTEVKFVFFVKEDSVQHARKLDDESQAADGALALETIGWYSQQRSSQKLPSGLAGRYPDAGRPDAGNFIAFAGTLESSRLVQDALSAFRPVSDFPAHGLAAPAYVQGVTLSDHSSYKHFGYPAIMITDTAFLRYPYYHTTEDTPDKFDYDGTARVLRGLARTITALAAGAQG